jgi:DNA invertase Pin-like site-specific DNA recombinase
MIFGYARVSTDDQDTAAQERALKSAGAEIVFLERTSGGRWDRPELHRLLDRLRPGDVVLVWKLDRLSRSLKDLLTIIERIDERQAGFKSLTEHVDTTSPAGRMMMQMVGAFAEFERAMIRERTRAGLHEAKEGGRVGGRRKKLKVHQEKEIAVMVLKEGRSAAQVARLFMPRWDGSWHGTRRAR